jgi:transcriptional regulator with XRE-family HTH domain
LSTPNRARAQFGNRLRRLREDAGLNGKELAAALGWAPSKVSRLETGQRTASASDVEAWTRAVRASPAAAAELREAHRVMRVEYDRWRLSLRRGHGPRQRALVGLEASTSLVRAFEPDAIPGLLHTPDYARAILKGLTVLRETPDDVEEAVRLRLRRQEVLYDATKQFRFLCTEASLRHSYAPPGVMRGQLDRLLALSELESIELRVISFGVELPVLLHSAFWIFDEHLVLVETYSAELALRDPEDVRVYERAFEWLWETAAPAEKTPSLIKLALGELDARNHS